MRRRLAALSAAVLTLAALAVARGAGGGPPLYDGVCLPPSYLELGSIPGPGSVSTTYNADQLQQTLVLTTPENPTPQAQVIIASGTLTPAPGATSVTFTITPVPPPPAHPDGAINGNVYEFIAKSGAANVEPAPGHPVTIALESAATGNSSLKVEHYDGGRWTALKTFQSGCGTTYEVATPSLGTFALVAVGASSSPRPASPTPSGGAVAPGLLVLLGVALLLGAAIAAARITRRRRLS